MQWLCHNSFSRQKLRSYRLIYLKIISLPRHVLAEQPLRPRGQQAARRPRLHLSPGERIPDLGEAEVLEMFYVGGGETGYAVVAEGEG